MLPLDHYTWGETEGTVKFSAVLHAADRMSAEVAAVSDQWLMIVMSAAAADLLTTGEGMARFARKVGLGKIRKDLSTPLMAKSGKLWIEQSLERPVVVAQLSDAPEDRARIELVPTEQLGRRPGQLPLAPAMLPLMGGETRAQVGFILDLDFLAAPNGRDLVALAAEGRAWGGLVSVTAGESPRVR